MKITDTSIKRPVTISMIFLIITVLGLFFYSKLGLDLLPKIKYPTVSIITTYSGVNPEDIENLITKPIEDAVSTVQNVKSVSSFSQEGLSAVIIEFNWGTNTDFAAQDVRDRIGLIEDYLPVDADKPMVFKLDISEMPILGYGITAEGIDTLQLKKLIKDNIKDRLERIEGVASVELRGGMEREIIIKINKPKIEALEISQDQIIQALRAENLNVSGGSISQEKEELPVRTNGEYKSLSEIKNTIITLKNNVPIYLKDIAEVIDGHKEIQSYSRTNKKASVLLLITKESEANTVQVVERVKKEIPNLKKYLPKNTNFTLSLDQSHLIKNATNSVKQSALIGGILSAFLIFLFLRNWRPTLTIIFAIPLSVITTFIPLYLSGYTLNLMTLGGLALGIGMLTDNAVVVIENIYRHLEQGKNKKEAARIGASEVGLAITASTLTTIAVFFPMSLGSGIAGQLTRGLTLTIVFALVSSLFVALTFVPMVASKIFQTKKNPEEYKELSGEKHFQKIESFYKKFLIWTLNNRLKTISITLFLFFLTIGTIPFIGTEFMPSSDQSILMMEVKMPVGTSLKETNKIISQVEDVILKKGGNNLESVTSFVGKVKGEEASISLGFGGSGTNEAQIMIRLKDKKERNISSEEFKERVRKNIPPIRGLEYKFVDMDSMIMGGSNAPIEIKIFGKDLEKLKKISADVATIIKEVKGIRDIESSLNQTKKELVIKVNKEEASRFGLTSGQIGLAVKNAIKGVVATQFRQSGEETDIRVKYDEKYRNNIEDIKNIIIPTPLGKSIYLKQVAQISFNQEPVKIDRENQSRIGIITANTSGRDIGSIVKDIKEKLKKYKMPSGYFVEFGGSYKQMKETFSVLGQALVLAVLLVYMIMASQFESLIYPFIIMFEIPLAFIGVGLALLIAKQSLSLPSMIGVIMLSGVVVNNAIVLVDYVNQLRRKGIDRFQALVEGGKTRLRPILITSLTTILGMLPMALSRQEGSDMMRPMAIAVIGGLFVSTALTLIIIPVLYSIIEDISLKTKEKIKKYI